MIKWKTRFAQIRGPGSLGESPLEKPRYDVFLSHATADKPVVEELARILTNRGFSPWLDKWNLIPGDPWQEAIEKALEDCAACAVCLGPSGTGPWQIEEMRAAIDARVSDRSRQFRVIPVLLPGSERGEPSRYPAFLRATTWVEFRETLEDEKALHRLISGIRGLPPGPDPGEAVAEGVCPYRGLQVFDVGDSLFFFGREALTEWLLDKLRTDRSGNRFLAIVGPSGSGKSSLARAGLAAALKQGKIPGSDAWPAVICKPGAQPLESLAIALAGAARLGDSPSAVLNLIRDLGTNPSLLHLTTRLSLREAPADRRFVVLVDQFEEVFTLCPDETQRRAIIDNLLHAATMADGQTVVVLTLRADFYGRCAAYPDLAAAVSDRQSLVGPMTRDELRSAIERPAYLTGCELEGGLADLLMNEVEPQPGSLPLLEHALLQIWERKEGGRRLTIDAYREIGGVAGALEKQAEEVYTNFSDEEKETCRRVFLRLVQVDEQGRATKRRLGRDDLAPANSPVETVVFRLTDARLLTTGQEKQPTVELVHEALLNNWARLKQWIEQDREALRTRRRLDEAVAEWLGKNRDPSFLLEGGRLAQVEEWAESHAAEMGPDARELMEGSIASRDQERQRELAQVKALEEEQRRRADAEHLRAEEQLRARRRLRKWTGAAIATALVAFAAAGFALYLRHVADQQSRISLASEISERSKTVSSSNPQLGLLLAAQSLKMARDAGNPYLPAAQSALRWALARSGGTPLASGPVLFIASPSDHRLLVTLGKDRHVRIWDLLGKIPPASNRDLGELPGRYARLAVSPNGERLIIAREQGIQILDLRDPSLRLTSASIVSGEDWLFSSEPFSPDGRWLVTRREGRFCLRDLLEPKAPQICSFLGREITTLSFSPDSLTLAATSRLGPIELWRLNMPPNRVTSVKIGLPKDSQVKDLVFQDNDLLLATIQNEHDDSMYGAISHGFLEGLHRLRGCSARGKIFRGPSGISFLCEAGDDSKIWSGIWKINLKADSEPVIKWPFAVETIDFSRDGLWAALGDLKGSIYLQGVPELKIASSAVQATPAQSMFFVPSSNWLLTQGGTEAPRFWNTKNINGIANFEPQILRIPDPWSLTITSKGELLCSDPILNRLRSWKLTKEPSAQDFPGLESANCRGAVSANGRWNAGVDQKGVLQIWPISADGILAQPISLSTSPDITSIDFSPGGRWLAVGEMEGKVFLWDLKNLKAAPYALTNLPRLVGSVAFAPGDRLLATAGPPSIIRLRELTDAGPRLADSPGPTTNPFYASALAFDNTGEWLAMGGVADRIWIWKRSGLNVYLDNRNGPVSSLAFSSDGRWIAAGGERGGIQLWRWNGEKTEPTPILLAGHTGYVRSIAFTPQGLVTAADDRTIRLWELRTNKLLDLACQSAGRTLSKREWANYIPSEPYQKDEPCYGLPKAID
jgi:WD40 repeat protein